MSCRKFFFLDKEERNEGLRGISQGDGHNRLDLKLIKFDGDYIFSAKNKVAEF